jgi:cytochrome c biogenesis protein CcmG, thiol:disulfide interchange protein DsbE
VRRIDPNRFTKPAALAAAAILVGFVSYAVVSATTAKSTTNTFPMVPPATRLGAGRHAPPFALRALHGSHTVAFRGASATPVIVNFFASWCENCVAELDAFGKVSSEATGVRFIGVDTLDSNPGLATRLLDRAHIGYAIGVDSNGTIASRYLIIGLPVTFFVSRSDVIQGEIIGTATSGELSEWVHRLGGSVHR